MHVVEAVVNWAGQQFTVQGELRRGDSAPVIDAQIRSPGIDLAALLASGADTDEDERADAAASGSVDPATDPRSKGLRWPLPLTGRIALQADAMSYRGQTAAPVVATLVLEQQLARIQVEQADYCGIALPLTVEATPAGYAASARITAHAQQLEQIAHCMSNSSVLVSGMVDLNADISTSGQPGELTKNLQGTIGVDVHDGRVMKFAVIGNILAAKSVTELFKRDAVRLDADGFPYRLLSVRGHFDQGRYIIDEGLFRSPAVGLAATGWVDVTDYQSRLTVLVAPFSRVDDLVRKIPVLSYVLSDTLTSVPVGVNGDIRDPLVIPLSPAAVTSNLLAIFERTLKLPARLVTPSTEGTER